MSSTAVAGVQQPVQVCMGLDVFLCLNVPGPPEFFTRGRCECEQLQQGKEGCKICSLPHRNINCLLQLFLLPHPQFGIKLSWIILISEICLDGGLFVWVERAEPSATLGDLARQRQLNPYGSFLYETLEQLFKNVCANPPAKHQVSWWQSQPS